MNYLKFTNNALIRRKKDGKIFKVLGSAGCDLVLKESGKPEFHQGRKSVEKYYEDVEV